MFPERVAMYRKKKEGDCERASEDRSQRGKSAQNEKWFFSFIRTNISSDPLPWRLLVKWKVDLSGFCQKELCEKDKNEIIMN